MLSVQEISDRLEIQQVLAEYSHAVDQQEWDLLDDVFAADAVLDYRATGVEAADVASLKSFLAGVMPHLTPYYHLTGTTRIFIDGDRADTRTLCLNPLGAGGHGSLIGNWYVDRWARTAAGWRIAERRYEPCFDFSLAGGGR
ncbi:MAG TPA: nuclear transport factor 2 family protein [Acidimicrobiales bacterium]|nr:nuclear transport factor 2 family protein [Acidimicrobiales bacterium]